MVRNIQHHKLDLTLVERGIIAQVRLDPLDTIGKLGRRQPELIRPRNVAALGEYALVYRARLRRQTLGTKWANAIVHK